MGFVEQLGGGGRQAGEDQSGAIGGEGGNCERLRLFEQRLGLFED